MDVYIERGVGAHTDDATVAWVFDLEHWGRCGQGHDEPTALTTLEPVVGRLDSVRIVERISGDERAFQRDRAPATSAELTRTLEILGCTRRQTLDLIASASPAELDWDDPERVLPAWAGWRTLRQMAWHIADTESRYYLPQLGVPPLSRGADILEELARSHEHVRTTLPNLPPDLYRVAPDGQEWTTVKILRRLAWHERSELTTMRRLLERARLASTS